MFGIPFTASATNWSFMLGSGADYNVPTRLKITQSNHRNIIVRHAHYKTHPFQSPIFYDIQIGKWEDQAAWEIEFLHHKIYLEDRPAEIQNFSISHGYNLLYLNRAWLLKHDFRFRIGLGAVIAHPENEINHKSLDHSRGGTFGRGYYLAGFSGQVGAGRRFYFTKHIYGSLGGKVLLSYAWVPVKDGDAVVPNLALYGIFGLGYST